MTWNYDNEVLASTPLIYWKFDEPSGTTVIDYSGNGYDAVYFGTDIIYGVQGINSDEADRGVYINSGVAKDAGVILNPVPDDWPTTDLTIEYVARNTANFSPDQGLRTLLSYATGSELNEIRQYPIGSGSTVGWTMFGTAANMNTGWNPTAVGGASPANTHQCVTWRNSDGRVQYFINGQRVGQAMVGGGNSIGVKGSFVIAQNQGIGGVEYPCATLMCGMAIYDRVLSNNEICNHATAALTSYYKTYSWPAPFILQDGDPESEIVSFATAEPIVPPGNFFQRVWDLDNLVWCYWTGVVTATPTPAQTTPPNSGNISDHQIVAIIPEQP